jgi:hypothetical protein
VLFRGWLSGTGLWDPVTNRRALSVHSWVLQADGVTVTALKMRTAAIECCAARALMSAVRGLPLHGQGRCRRGI